MEQAYESLKQALLTAGATGALPIARMEAGLRRASAVRRGLQQAAKSVLREA
jgi:phosphate:Na+ symporter